MVCCDLCDASAFVDVFGGPAIKAPRKSKKAHVPPFDMTRLCYDLRTALYVWRDERTIARFGRAALKKYSGSVILPAPTLARIVGCAQAEKIITLDSLRRELQGMWRADLIEQHGQEVLDIVHASFPPPPPDSEPENVGSVARGRSDGRRPVAARKPRQPVKCGACEQSGHTREYCNLLVPWPP